MKSNSKEGLVTDLDFIVSLGYKKEDAKKTLKLTNGDRDAALRILAKGGIKESDLQWRIASDSDWINGISKFGLPTDKDGRALHRSPIYIRVGSYKQRDDNDYEFMLTVTLKDGRQWSVGRTYREFSELKSSLPMGTCANFKHNFHLHHAFFKMFNELSSNFLTNRRDRLAEWIRELTLDEKAMQNPKVLAELNKFIDIDSHGGPVSETKDIRHKDSELGVAESHHESNAGKMSPLNANRIDFAEHKHSIVNEYPAIATEVFPYTIAEMRHNMPFKLEVKKLKCFVDMAAQQQKQAGSGDVNEMTIDLYQLGKDLSRDRLVVQGKKIFGAHTELAEVVWICKQAITHVVESAQHRLLPAAESNLELLDRFAKAALQFVSRTESAFLSHTSINEMLDVANIRYDSAFTPFVVVPESTLAEPMQLNFRVQERGDSKSIPHATMVGAAAGRKLPPPPSKEWCIVCEGEATTVFRILDAETMGSLLQLKITYVNTLFALPQYLPGTTQELTGLQLKMGKTFLIVRHDTTTTTRDWG